MHDTETGDQRGRNGNGSDDRTPETQEEDEHDSCSQQPPEENIVLNISNGLFNKF